MMMIVSMKTSSMLSKRVLLLMNGANDVSFVNVETALKLKVSLR